MPRQTPFYVWQQLRPASSSGPDPRFLTAATVRQVSDWALLNGGNAQVLRQAIHGGVYILLDLYVLWLGVAGYGR